MQFSFPSHFVDIVTKVNDVAWQDVNVSGFDNKLRRIRLVWGKISRLHLNAKAMKKLYKM